MTTLPTLYSRTSTGKIQQWTIEVAGEKYRTISGQTEGVKTTSEWTVCVGKNIGRANETSPQEQAENEATAKHTKQLKLDYFESVEEIDTARFLSPMLAKNWNDCKQKVKYPVFVDRKYNGMRCVVQSIGAYTRKGEQIPTIPHVLEELNSLFEKFPKLVLDSEIYNHALKDNLNDLISIVRRTKNITQEHLEKSKETAKIYVYDGWLGQDGITEKSKYSDRKKALRDILSDLKYVVVVDNIVAKNGQEVEAAYQQYIKEGMEGAIVRQDTAYAIGKRSSSLLKKKEMMDDEFLLIDVLEGVGNRSGMAGTVMLKMENGSTFAANLNGNESEFAEVLRNKQNYIGKKVTIFYFGFTGLGTPQYAQFQVSNFDKGDR